MPRTMPSRDEFEEELEQALDLAEGSVGEDPEDAESVAREVVGENGIESTDFIEYQALMDARGFSRDTTKSLWDQMREDGTVPSQHDGQETVDVEVSELIDLDPEEIEEMHLFTIEGCPACEAFKERMREPIEAGVLNLQNIDEDDEAADLAAEVEVDRTPLLVAETADGFEEMM